MHRVTKLQKQKSNNPDCGHHSGKNILIMKRLFIALCLMMPALLTAQRSPDKSDYDKQIAAEYGLAIPAPPDQLEPAPEWLRNKDMIFTDWTVNADMLNTPFKLWKGYRVELKDTLVERIVRMRPLSIFFPTPHITMLLIVFFRPSGPW